MIESPADVKEMYEFTVRELKEQLKAKATENLHLRSTLGGPGLNQTAP